ncbi:BPSS1780 family membrane protein [[Pseudomonas] boreopolis]|uniref:BPSS1780 family membrane protein n=1 Tax=Xanthomonas boreopolis TaxID=86183 RepID=UPI003DA0858E
MREIHKVPASSGAEWLLTGFSLLRRAPLALGSLGVTWGLIASLALLLAGLVPALGTAVQFLLVLAGPLFMGGLLWAVREVDQGRPAKPSHLLHGLQDGRAPHLLVALLPQIIAGLLLGIALLVLIGTKGLQQLSDVMVQLNAISASGAQPDPGEIEALAATLPAGRILLWLLLVLATFAALTLALFVMPPQVMFDQSGGWKALRNSLRASIHNLPAMLVFFVLAFIALFAIYFAVMIVALVIGLLAGQGAAMWVAQLLLMGVLMPVFAGAVYAAWKQMFTPPGSGPAGTGTPPPGNVFAA